MPRVQFIPSADSAWSSLRLAAPLGLPWVAGGDATALEGAPVMLVPDGDTGAALVARPGARVRLNGRPVPGGLRVLVDRDEILVEGCRYYYAARDPLGVEAYAGPAAACPRCSGMIHPGATAVRCHCGAWFHQSTEQPCFTYGESCPACNGPTRLEADPWDPSVL